LHHVLLHSFFGGKNGKKTKYEDFTWNQLPRGARNAAETLGLDQSSWDAKGWSQTEEKSWSGLTSNERDAATTLGWDESAWDNKYNDKNWSDLPGHVQSAAQNLGFTQQMWDNDKWPAVGDKYWDAMSNDEKKALHTLGYYKYNWG